MNTNLRVDARERAQATATADRPNRRRMAAQARPICFGVHESAGLTPADDGNEKLTDHSSGAIRRLND
jgi:hypothetical protein